MPGRIKKLKEDIQELPIDYAEAIILKRFINILDI